MLSSGMNQVLPGVGELINEVQVEGTFPDGTKLVRGGKQHNYVIGTVDSLLTDTSIRQTPL